MATDLKFRVSVVDNASHIGERIRRVLSRIAAPLDKMTRGTVSVGRHGVAALVRVEAALGKIANTARIAADRIASIVPGMAALTGLVGGAGGVAALADRWAKLGFNLQTTSRTMGMSAQSLRAWQFAAQRAGVSAEQFNQSVISSQNTVRQAAFGGNPQAMMLLNRLGVNISRGKGGAIDYQKTQSDIMSALGRIRDPVGQRTAAEELGMGGILPMIQRGTYNRDRLQAMADGYAPSDAAIQRAAQFRYIMFGFNTQMSDLGNTIGITLAPILEPMVGQLTTWLNSHRLAIAQAFGDAVGKFAAWITSVNWGDLFNKVQAIVDKFGGWGSVLRDIVAIKFAATLAGWTSSIVALVASLGAAKTAATALKAVAGGAAAGAATGAGAGASVAAATGLGGLLASPFGLWAATSLVRTGGLLYSPSLNTGEQGELNLIKRGAGKHYMTAAQSYPKGANDPKVVGAVNRFMAMGWTAEQASGIVSNIMQESHLNPYAVGDGGAAYGIGQWHADRQADFKRVFGHSMQEGTLEEQEKFFNWELLHGKRMTQDAGDRLAGAATAADAGAIVSRYDLRPRDTQLQMAERGKLAEQVLGAWQKANGVSSASAGPAQQININVSAPPGTRVDATGPDGAGMPTRVNYQMLGAMP